MRIKAHLIPLFFSLASISMATKADDLLQIYQQALTKDPQLSQVKAQRDSAFAAIDESRASLLPQISGSLGYGQSYSDDFGTSNDASGDLSIALSQSLYDQSNFLGLALAEKQASKSDAEYALSRQALAIRVTEAYFDVLSALDSLEFSKANRKAIEKQLEQTKQRFAVGLVAITDVHEAQAQFDLAEAEVIEADNERQNSYEGLRILTGLAHRQLAVLNTERFSPSKPVPSSHKQWQVLAEEHSLELLRDRLGVDIAKEQIKSAKAGHLPSISLTASANRAFGEGEVNDGLRNDTSGNLAITVDVPIFSGFSITSQVEQAKYNFVASSHVLEQTHRSMISDLRNALNNVNAALSSIKAYQQSVVSAESALNATEAGFEVGTRTVVEVLDATRQLYSSKEQLAQSRYDYILAVLALKQASGTLSESDIRQINNGLNG